MLGLGLVLEFFTEPKGYRHSTQLNCLKGHLPHRNETALAFGYRNNALNSLSLGAATSRTVPAITPFVTNSRFNSSLAAPLPSGGSVVKAVNEQLATGSEGRLFAVVQLCGKQFKITAGDIIIVEGYWPPTNGDRIRLDKVLLAGGKDFSLIGRPLVPAGLVDVQATIIEKSLSHTSTEFEAATKGTILPEIRPLK